MQSQTPNLDSQLSPKQREVLLALVQGSSISAAASATRLHRSTIHNWCRQNPLFRAALRDAESQHASAVLDGFRHLTTTALERLANLINDPKTPPGVCLRAITLVLDRVSAADPYTKPAEPRLTTGDVDQIVEAASHAGASEPDRREAPGPQPVPQPQIARNAPCPCGSGDKFKRCCGKGAPGLFNQARAA